MNQKTLKLLFLEDSLFDVELCVKELQRAGYEVEYEVVQSREEFLQELRTGDFDVMLADYNFPGYSGMDALREYRELGCEKPFLIVSGSIGEETAVESIKAGANDYVLKDRLVRLPSAVQQALENWQMRIRQKHAEEALRESNETLHALVQASPLAIVVLDRKGYVRMWNRAAENTFGWTQSEVVGHPYPIVPADRRDEYMRFRERVLQGESLTNVEMRRIKKDGAELDISISAAPLRDAQGRVCNIMTILADVTERKQVEQARREMERYLDEAKRMFYRETILAVTNGKLEIVDPPELATSMNDAPIQLDLTNPSQLGPARREIQRFFEANGLRNQRLMDFVLGVGEAMTNALKHGEYGHVYAGNNGGKVWVTVADRGPGIDALVLPGATLRRGFSTKPSLGLGYSVILNVSDLVKLNTGPNGTTVMMEKFIKEPETGPVLEFLPDTW